MSVCTCIQGQVSCPAGVSLQVRLARHYSHLMRAGRKPREAKVSITRLGNHEGPPGLSFLPYFSGTLRVRILTSYEYSYELTTSLY